MIRCGIFSVVALLALAAPAAAQTNAKSADDKSPSAKSAYDELCLSCHKQPQRLSARLAKTAEARAKLDEFLVKHYAPDAEKRAAVINFLYQAK